MTKNWYRFANIVVVISFTSWLRHEFDFSSIQLAITWLAIVAIYTLSAYENSQE